MLAYPAVQECPCAGKCKGVTLFPCPRCAHSLRAARDWPAASQGTSARDVITMLIVAVAATSFTLRILQFLRISLMCPPGAQPVRSLLLVATFPSDCADGLDISRGVGWSSSRPAAVWRRCWYTPKARKLTFLSIKLTFLSVKLTFLSAHANQIPCRNVTAMAPAHAHGCVICARGWLCRCRRCSSRWPCW